MNVQPFCVHIQRTRHWDTKPSWDWATAPIGLMPANWPSAGFITIAPSYPMLAGYWPDVFGLGYESGTMKAIWDNIRAIDLLETLPYLKRAPVGAIGPLSGRAQFGLYRCF